MNGSIDCGACGYSLTFGSTLSLCPNWWCSTWMHVWGSQSPAGHRMRSLEPQLLPIKKRTVQDRSMTVVIL